MPNDSSTGGFLTPVPSTLPIEGQALNRFIQQWLAAIIQLDGSLIRPEYQSEPPDIPNAGEAWCAFRFHGRVADTFPYIQHIGSGTIQDIMQRHEQLELLTTFYDLGTNGLADFYAEQLREGVAIPQNLEYLDQQNFKLAYVGGMTAVPVLVKSRWQYRVDFPITLRRQINVAYQVLNLASMQGTLYTDTGLPPRNIGVTE